MKLVVFVLLGAFASAGLLGALASRLRYVLTGRHLKVTLFGLSVRRIRLADIDSVSKRQSHRAEKWFNTLKPAHRMLVIRRRRGWLKDKIYHAITHAPPPQILMPRGMVMPEHLAAAALQSPPQAQ